MPITTAGPTDGSAPTWRFSRDFNGALICDAWELRETVLPQSTTIPLSESLFSVGNGNVGVRGYAEETATLDMPFFRKQLQRRSVVKAEQTNVSRETEVPENSLRGTYVNGIYEERLLSQQRAFTIGTCVRECFLIRVPDAFCVDLFVGGEHVNTQTGTIITHTRVLDFRTGELHRSMKWFSKQHNREVTVDTYRFVSSARKNIAAMRYVVSAKHVSNTDIRIVSRTVLPQDEQNKYLGVENVVAKYTIHNASSAVCVRTRNSCKRLAVAVSESCVSCVTEDLMGGLPGASSTSLPGTTDSLLAVSPEEALHMSFPNAAAAGLSGQQSPGNGSNPMLSSPTGNSATTTVSPKCNETESGVETIFTSILSGRTRVELVKFIAYLGDEDAPPEDINDVAMQSASQAAQCGYENLFAEQRKELSKFWETADVRVRSKDPSIQGAFRFNTLQLFMSAGRFRLQGFPTRGLTGELFGGLHQWDVEVFIVPYFTHVHPETARALLQFRIDTLPMAKDIAADMDLPKGALYPPRTVNGGNNSASTTCAAHLHVNAIVVYAIWQYYEATDDMGLMLKGGAQVIFSTALVWILWGTWDRGQFHFRSVSGPDEYNGMADNNFFTNLMAKYHMLWAVRLARTLQEKYPKEWATIMEQSEVTEKDIELMAQAADRVALFFDAKYRVHPVDQAFMRKKKWPFNDIKVRRTMTGSYAVEAAAVKPGASNNTSTSTKASSNASPTRHGTPSASKQREQVNSESTTEPKSPTRQDRVREAVLLKRYHPNVIFRHQVCKIPDVMLAAMMLPHTFTRDEVMADFKFYEPITTNDSAISLPIFSLIASRLSIEEKALSYFHEALFVDIANINGNAGGGLHSSTAAGSWLCLASGFGGMRIVKGIIHFDPILPKDWEEYQFSARHKGYFLRVQVNRRVATYTVLEAPSKEELLVIHANFVRLRLTKNAPQFVRLQRNGRTLNFDAVVFDMDSVIEDVEEDHFASWRDTLEPFLAETIGTPTPLTRELYLAYFRHGRPYSGIQRILTQHGVNDFPVGSSSDPAGNTTLYGLCNRKLENFRQIVKKRGIKMRPGAMQLIADLRRSGIAVGCVTASKNGDWLLHQSPQLLDAVDYFIDGVAGESVGLRWRPDVDYFDECARCLDCQSKRTILVTDGIDGFSKNALQNFMLIIDTSPDPEEVKDWSVLRLCYRDLTPVTVDLLDEESMQDAHLGSISKRRAHGTGPTQDRQGQFGDALWT